MRFDTSATELDPLAGFQPVAEFFEKRMQRASRKTYSPRSIERLIRNGQIPVVSIGAAKFVDLNRLAEQLRAQPPITRTRRCVRLSD
jgi:hypothetical protein